MRASLEIGRGSVPRGHSPFAATARTTRICMNAAVAVALASVISFTTPASAQTAATGPESSAAVSESTPVTALQSAAESALQPASGTPAQPNDDRYRDGMVIWETPADVKVPFLLRFNINTQLRYLNTQDSDETFTDHMGVEHDVHTRNDITVNRAMFILGGYIFDPRLRYSFTVWT